MNYNLARYILSINIPKIESTILLYPYFFRSNGLSYSDHFSHKITFHGHICTYISKPVAHLFLHFLTPYVLGSVCGGSVPAG